MNSNERITIALRGGIPDRVPVVNVFNMNYLVKELKSRGVVLSGFDPENLEKIIQFQEDIGHDPIYYLHTFQEPEVVKLPESFMKWKSEDRQNWEIKEKEYRGTNSEKTIERIYNTPKGSLKAKLQRKNYQAWILEHPLKNRDDINLLEYRADPSLLDTSIIEKLHNRLGKRGFFTIGIPSVFQEGCALRGMDQMIYDIMDEPEWTKTFFEVLTDYSVKLARKLGSTGIDSVFINESYVGMGMTPDMYSEYILPFDRKIIEAANSTGMITSLHICGKCDALLEQMADSGATCIEPLAPSDYAGDVQLMDAKSRIGSKVGLWGGFRERVLTESKEEVKKEVMSCFSAAKENGGYILRGTGQIYDARYENLKYLKELAEEYGTY